MKKVAVVYFDAGSGHRSAARGLAAVLSESKPQWQVNTVDIVDVFAHNKRFHRIVQMGIDYFNWCIKEERFFDLRGLINLSLLCHDLLTLAGIRQIANYWIDSPPDAVVSVTPMYNPALYRSVRLVNPEAVCITIPVDFEEVRPRYWFTPKVEQRYLLATDRLVEQARKAGISDGLIHRTPGMIIDPQFYSDPPVNVREEIERLELDPDLPTGLVSFGGQGSILVRDIARRLARSFLNDLKLNMIFLCGRNTAVFNEVNNLATHYRKLVLAYAEKPPVYYHQLADFMIGKPGSMTITETLISGKPLVFIKSRGLAPVQRGNEAWVLGSGVGVMANGMGRLIPAIQEVLASCVYGENAARHKHDGIFETAKIIRRLVEPSTETV